MTLDPAAHDVMREQAAAYALGALTGEERTAFEAHLETCAACGTDVRGLLQVATVLARTVPQVEPPRVLRDRVLAQTGQTDRESSVPASLGRGSVSQGTRPPLWLSELAVAASLALAVAFGGYAFQLRGRLDTLEARLQDALARAQASENREVDIRRVMGGAQSQLAVLTAPDVTRVDMAGQPVAPSAAARAFWSRSRGLVLAASSLPALPPGRTYQLWFVAGKNASSAGIFEPDTAGAASILLTVDPNIPRPDVLAVTIEPSGGLPQPTGAMYLVGNVQTL